MTWGRPSWIGDSNYVAHEVNGTPLHFYAVSVKLFFRAKALGGPLAKALTAVMEKHNGAFTGWKTHIMDDVKVEEQIAISHDLWREKTVYRETAIASLIEAFCDRKNASLVGELLMDSLREEFAESKPAPQDLMNSLPLETLLQMLNGMWKANKDALVRGKILVAEEGGEGSVTPPQTTGEI